MSGYSYKNIFYLVLQESCSQRGLAVTIKPPWEQGGFCMPNGIMLKVKHRLSACSDFFERGIPVASYDGGPCNLTFADGKTYLFTLQSPGWVKNLVYPVGEAKIASVVDFHYAVVDDEALASEIHTSFSGVTTYYKEGNPEVVAHSETPLDNAPELILCNGKEYKVLRNKGRFGSSVVELYEKDNCVALIKTKLFRTKSTFKKNLTLPDRVFITLLAFDWGLNNNETFEKRNVDDSPNFFSFLHTIILGFFSGLLAIVVIIWNILLLPSLATIGFFALWFLLCYVAYLIVNYFFFS
jgi:hypothetical protein